jgi:uncharacterized protein YdeI (YjbR/CyaY-like superfamily)
MYCMGTALSLETVMARSADIDAYIESAAPFAQPILRKLRELFHKACPQIEEKLKWSVPAFDYKGPVGGMAAFKAHASFGFWKAKLMKDPQGLFNKGEKGGMWGARLESVKELPPDKVLVAYIKEAVALNEMGIKAMKPTGKGKPAPKVPDYMLAALRKNKVALKTFEAFPPSHKREYIDWITEAKQDATRDRRLQQAIEWMAEGKSRNWKYRKQ